MRLKNYGRERPCRCCGGDSRPLYGTDQDVLHRRYCSPCWNTMGVAPTSENPWADDNSPATIDRRHARGWGRLVNG